MQLNFFRREVNYKIVYYGPKASGKKTNLEHIYHKIPVDLRGDLIATSGKEALFFDLAPFALGIKTEVKIKLRLCTAPCQPNYKYIRNFIFQGVDGIVFVADSQRHRFYENLESLKSLEASLHEQGINIGDLAMVIQWNKRDCQNIPSVAELESRINYLHAPSWEAVASVGRGVFATLKKCASMGLTKKIHAFYSNALYESGRHKYYSPLASAGGMKFKKINDGETFLDSPKMSADDAKEDVLGKTINKQLIYRATETGIRMRHIVEPFSKGLGTLIYTQGEIKDIGPLKASLECAIASLPRILIEYLLFNFSLKTGEFKVRFSEQLTSAGSNGELSKVVKYKNRIELVLGETDLDEFTAGEILAEVFAAYILPDYHFLKAEYYSNENAYFKLELVKSLLNYRNYYKKYHKYTNRVKGSCGDQGGGPTPQKCFLEMWFLALESKSLIFQLGREPISFRHVFREIMEDNEPKWVILNYLHIFLRNFLIRQGVTESLLAKQYAMVADNFSQCVYILLKNILLQRGMRSTEIRNKIKRVAGMDFQRQDISPLAEFLDESIVNHLQLELEKVAKWRKYLEYEIFAIVRKIAKIDIPSKFSIAKMRNFFKEFIYDGKISLAGKNVAEFKFFDTTLYLRELRNKILLSENIEDFYMNLEKALSTVLGSKQAQKRVQNLFHEIDSKAWAPGKANLIKTVIEKVLAEWMGKRSYRILQGQFSGQKINSQNIPLLLDSFTSKSIWGIDKDWLQDLFIMEPPL